MASEERVRSLFTPVTGMEAPNEGGLPRSLSKTDPGAKSFSVKALVSAEIPVLSGYSNCKSKNQQLLRCR